ncbi:MAG: hypothetical protein OSJ74_06740, partial [Clostridia bacterium]|nr:hypothetical protein [Clostridia bacterium]
YSYNKIANMFQSVFVEYYESIQDDPELIGSFDGRTPVFVWEGTEIDINAFRNMSGDAYTDLTEPPERVEVRFVLKSYTVTYDPNNEGNVWRVEDVKYNKFLSRPTNPSNGSKLFMGWYYETEEIDTATGQKKLAKWDFDQDRVTRDITLVAQWLVADKLVSIEIEVVGKEFIAGDKIKKGQLKVTANFEGKIGEEVVKQGMELDWEEYESGIEIDALGGVLHITDPSNPNVGVSVTYEYNGQSVTETVDVRVTPRKIDTSGLDFGQDANNEIRMEADGTPKNLPEPDESELLNLGIDSVRFEYYDGKNNKLEPEDVVRAGRYTVKVIFESSSYDEAADELTFTLVLGTFTEVTVEWSYDSENPYVYNGKPQAPTAKVYRSNGSEIGNIKITYSGDTEAITSGEYVIKAELEGTYRIVSGESCEFKIVKAKLEVPQFEKGSVRYDGKEKNICDYLKESGYNEDLMETVGDGAVGTGVGTYRVTLRLKDTANCSWADGSTGSKVIEWSIEKALLIPNWDNWEFVYDGESGYAPKITGIADGLAEGDSLDANNDFVYKIYDENGNEVEASQVSEVGSYKIVAKLNGDLSANYEIDEATKEWSFVVVPKSGMTILTVEWDETQFRYDGSVHYPTYKVYDRDGNDVTESLGEQLKFSEGYRTEKELGTYRVSVSVKDSETYFIRSGTVCVYKIVDEHGYAPSEEETNNRDEDKDGEDKDGGMSFDNVGEMLKQWWQVIASGVSIVLIVAFLAKTASYESRRKDAKKTQESKYSNYYAAGTTGLFGLAMTGWTAIACALMGCAAASLAIMLIAKSRCKKAERSLADSKEEYERNRAESEARQRDENMRMMFMSMMGGQGNMQGQGMPQGAYMGGGYGIGVEEMRGLISETVTAMLPGVQQMLPQQASTNDELVNKLIEQNEKLMQRLAEQPTEKVVEREVAASNSNDETLKQLTKTQEELKNSQEKFMERSQKQDETISQLMEKILELSVNQQSQPQVIEKIVEKPVEIEKIVEVPVEKIVEKEVKVEVPVEVEKIVEKEVRVEV